MKRVMLIVLFTIIIVIGCNSNNEIYFPDNLGLDGFHTGQRLSEVEKVYPVKDLYSAGGYGISLHDSTYFDNVSCGTKGGFIFSAAITSLSAYKYKKNVDTSEIRDCIETILEECITKYGDSYTITCLKLGKYDNNFVLAYEWNIKDETYIGLMFRNTPSLVYVLSIAIIEKESLDVDTTQYTTMESISKDSLFEILDYLYE